MPWCLSTWLASSCTLAMTESGGSYRALEIYGIPVPATPWVSSDVSWKYVQMVIQQFKLHVFRGWGHITIHVEFAHIYDVICTYSFLLYLVISLLRSFSVRCTVFYFSSRLLKKSEEAEDQGPAVPITEMRERWGLRSQHKHPMYISVQLHIIVMSFCIYHDIFYQ